MCRSRLPLLLLCTSLLWPSASALGAGRTVAVLEFRAGVTAAPEIAEGVAALLSRLTSNKVIAPSEARRRMGPDVDAAVARCKGNAACISAVGRSLGCEEVIVVGVSQLGDLILVIQRIAVRESRVVARLADSLSPGHTLAEQTLTGYLQRLLPPSDFKRFGEIVLVTKNAGDKVFLDQEFRGLTPLAPLKVPAPGRYTIRVKRASHEDFVTRLDVLPEASVEVAATLSRISPPTRWYQHWWVWALVGGVLAGGASAVAAVSASRSPEQVPAVVELGR